MPHLIYGRGLIGGLFLFVGPIIARYFLVPTIVSESGLKEISEYPVLVTINQLQTAHIERERRVRTMKNLLASAFSVAILIAVAALFLWKSYL